MRGDHKDYPVPEQQAVASLDQANPVSGTKYTVLDTTKNVRILSVWAYITWSVQPTPLEVHVTIDGQSQQASLTNPATLTSYFLRRAANGGTVDFALTTGTVAGAVAFLIEGRSIKIEIETTGGTVSNLKCKVKYQKW